METTPAIAPVTTASVGLRYGLLTGLASTIVSFALNAMQLEQSPAKWLSFIVLVGGVVVAQRFYKETTPGL